MLHLPFHSVKVCQWRQLDGAIDLPLFGSHCFTLTKVSSLTISSVKLALWVLHSSTVALIASELLSFMSPPKAHLMLTMLMYSSCSSRTNCTRMMASLYPARHISTLLPWWPFNSFLLYILHHFYRCAVVDGADESHFRLLDTRSLLGNCLHMLGDTLLKSFDRCCPFTCMYKWYMHNCTWMILSFSHILSTLMAAQIVICKEA